MAKRCARRSRPRPSGAGWAFLLVVCAALLAQVAGAVPSGAGPGDATGAEGSSTAGGGVGAVFVGLTPQRVMDSRVGLAATRFPPGGRATLPLRGLAGVPAEATAVALNVTVTNPTAYSYLTLWPSGTGQPGSSNLNFGPAETLPNAVVVGLGSNGAVDIFNAAGFVDVVVDVTGWFGAGFTPAFPTRAMDTRLGLGGGRFGPDSQQSLGLGHLAPPGAVGVAINVTATNVSADSFVTVWPGGQARPWSSNLNVARGQTIANAAVVGLGGDATLGIYNAAGALDVVVDVMGWFVGGINPVTPTRVMDTRISQCGGMLDPTESRTVQILGANGLPVSDVTGVALNVTAVGARQPTFLTVWPTGARPYASNVNADAGETIPNLVLVGVSPTGTVELYNELGPVEVVIDVTAVFTGGGAVAGGTCQVRKPPGPPPFISGVGSFGPGSYIVGSQIQPGRYAAAASAGCYWERLSGFGGTLDEIIANDFTTARVVVDIAPTDAGFRLGSGCATLHGYVAPANPMTVFGEGAHVVAKEIVAGLYQASGGDPSSCYWERVSSFGGRLEDILANDFGGATIVQIQPTDAGFISSRCGTWTRIG